VGSLRSKLKHAFAVDAPGAVEPTEQQRPAVEWICTQIAKRHLSTPGLIFFEMVRPLNYLGAQVMHFTRPGVWAIAPRNVYGGYIHFAEFLERRGSLEYMCRRIEELEAEYSQRDKAARTERKKKKSTKTHDAEHHDDI
jgi:hypothetical protein